MPVLEQQSAALPVLRTLCLQPEWFCTYAVGLKPDSSLSHLSDSGVTLSACKGLLSQFMLL